MTEEDVQTKLAGLADNLERLGFRNRIVHLYDRVVDPQIVYRVLVEDRAVLIDLARLLTDAVSPAAATR